MIERWCDLNGPRLLIRAEDEALMAQLESSWLRMETEAADRADYTLTINRGEVVPAPEGSPLLFDGILPDKLPCVLTQVGSGEHYRVDNRLSLLLSKPEGAMVVAPASEKLVRSGLTVLAVGAALATKGQYLLHAAALVLPDSDEAVLILGASGFGKTTTTLSLLPAGFRLLTDDTSVVKSTAEGDEVWALPRTLKVHAKTAALLPWIRPALTGDWNEDGEQPLTVAALARLAPIALPKPHPIRAIVVLGKRTAGDHEIRALPKSEMLTRIAGDNLSRTLRGVASDHHFRMRRFAELVSARPTFEFRAGPDLKTLPGVLLDGLYSPRPVPPCQPRSRG